MISFPAVKDGAKPKRPRGYSLMAVAVRHIIAALIMAATIVAVAPVANAAESVPFKAPP